MVREPQALRQWYVYGYSNKPRVIQWNGAFCFQHFSFCHRYVSALGFHPCTSSAFAFCDRQGVMNRTRTEELMLSLCLKWKPIIIKKSYISEKMSHTNTYSDEDQSNNILKNLQGGYECCIWKTEFGLFKKGKKFFVSDSQWCRQMCLFLKSLFYWIMARDK